MKCIQHSNGSPCVSTSSLLTPNFNSNTLSTKTKRETPDNESRFFNWQHNKEFKVQVNATPTPDVKKIISSAEGGEIKDSDLISEVDRLPRMRKYRFKLSDMIPNAWFYKLKDMSRTRKQHSSHTMKNNASSPTSTSQNSHFSHPRYSYYLTTESRRTGKLYSSPKNPKVLDTHFPESPRRSSKRKDRRKTTYNPSPRVLSFSNSATCNYHYPDNSVHDPHPTQSPDYSVEDSSGSDLNGYISSDSERGDHFVVPDMFDGAAAAPWSSSCSCRVSSSTKDIIIDMNNEIGTRKSDELDGFDTISESELPPPSSKPAKLDEALSGYPRLSMPVQEQKNVRIQKDQRRSSPRKSSASSTGIRLRTNSPKLATSGKAQGHARKHMACSPSKAVKNSNFQDSFAVVKSSVDPERDFRVSMMEMIVENNIQGSSKDLEDLLACYLSLNSKEYHSLIVKAFEQVWFEMAHLKL